MRKINWNTCKWKLAKLWLFCGAAIFILLVVLAMAGKFERGDGQDFTTEAFGWFSSTIMPNLLLIVAVQVADAHAVQGNKRKIEERFFSFALWTSAFYLLLVLVSLLATSLPMVPDSSRGIHMLRKSDLWLGLLHGVATSALGIFYVKGQVAEE